MPLVRITYPEGALTRDHKARLAAELTDLVLEAEVDAVTPSGKMVTVVQFHPVAAENWAVAGALRADTDKPVDHFVVDVIVLEALLDGARRTTVHRRVTEAFARAFPGDAMLPLRVWVLVHEVREGSWGAAGRTVSALDVARFINPQLAPALEAEITDGLAARKR